MYSAYENYVKRSGDIKAEDSCASETFIGESDVNDIKGRQYKLNLPLICDL